MDDTPTHKGRECGKCTLCCKVLGISALGKPSGSWCPHCAVGRGCKIYEDRPPECRNFHCGYLAWHMTGPHWFPASCKMVVVWEEDAARITVHVDQDRPRAWLEEPFHAEIRHWAGWAADHMHQLLVKIGDHVFAILPDRDVDLGIMQDDERIITGRRATSQGFVYDVIKLRADDPRVAGLAPGKSLVRADDLFGKR